MLLRHALTLYFLVIHETFGGHSQTLTRDVAVLRARAGGRKPRWSQTFVSVGAVLWVHTASHAVVDTLVGLTASKLLLLFFLESSLYDRDLEVFLANKQLLAQLKQAL